MTVSELTQRRVISARVKPRPYAIHDRGLTGFCLKVAPSGRKTYALDFSRDGARHRETLGDAGTMSLRVARALARERMKALNALHDAGTDTPFEAVAELAMQRHARLWKPGTMRVNRGYLANNILPRFIGRAIGSITRRDIEEWFAELHHIPAAANRSAPVLTVVMREAEAMGMRPEGSNPVEGLRTYRKRSRKRILAPEEVARLGAALDEARGRFPLQTAMLLLLVLTGCRRGEIENLHWRDYRDGHLHLRDSKSGPRKVFLSSHARAVLDGVETDRRGMVFPSRRNGGHITSLDYLWGKVRRRAGIEDVRLHDLRHNFATEAIRRGVSLTVVGRLLGHRSPDTTMRYAHLDEDAMRGAVEDIDGALSGHGEGDAQ